MPQKKTKRLTALFIVLGMVLLILLTRAAALEHNRALHPDEHVIYLAADSLKDRVLGRAPSFEEVKEYPEGSIVLQTPFHLAASLAGDAAPDPQIIGRWASVIFFTLGAVLWMAVLRRHFDNHPAALISGALIMVFSLIHIEQSRYGTGDAVSFFLLSWILLLCGAAADDGPDASPRRLFAAAFLAGVLGAVKYPLLFFTVLPAAVAARRFGKGWLRNPRTWGMVLLTAAGFLLCSPKLVADPVNYLYHLLAKESHDYLRYGNLCEVGGPVNHLLSLTVYLLLYSGLPLAPVFLVSALRRSAGPEEKDGETFLFRRVLPWALGVFFVYNLFAKSLFMRTYYPFFCLADLYAAAGAGQWFRRGGGRRRAAVLLAALLVIRGGWNVLAMTESDGIRRLETLVERASGENWRRTVLLKPGHFLPLDRTALAAPEETDLLETEPWSLDSGEMVITSTQAHSRCSRYILPSPNADARTLIRRWEDFQRLNDPWRVGSVYPEYYYWLFGYWVKGTTGTDYEFPTNTVYFRP